jgi:hypothetical protein
MKKKKDGVNWILKNNLVYFHRLLRTVKRGLAKKAVLWSRSRKQVSKLNCLLEPVPKLRIAARALTPFYLPQT